MTFMWWAEIRHRIWPGEGSTVQRKWSPPAPGSLKTLLFPPLLNNVQTRKRKGYRRGTSSIHLHCPVPRSSSLIGYGENEFPWFFMCCVFGCGFFASSWKFPTYNWASFLLTVDNFSFLTYNWSFFSLTVLTFFAYNCSFFAYSGKVRLIRALRDCEQRSLTVSKKTPTVSKKISPNVFEGRGHRRFLG